MLRLKETLNSTLGIRVYLLAAGKTLNNVPIPKRERRRVDFDLIFSEGGKEVRTVVFVLPPAAAGFAFCY